jgi:hypothetical protein
VSLAPENHRGAEYRGLAELDVKILLPLRPSGCAIRGSIRDGRLPMNTSHSRSLFDAGCAW